MDCVSQSTIQLLIGSILDWIIATDSDFLCLAEEGGVSVGESYHYGEDLQFLIHILHTLQNSEHYYTNLVCLS